MGNIFNIFNTDRCTRKQNDEKKVDKPSNIKNDQQIQFTQEERYERSETKKLDKPSNDKNDQQIQFTQEEHYERSEPINEQKSTNEGTEEKTQIEKKSKESDERGQIEKEIIQQDDIINIDVRQDMQEERIVQRVSSEKEEEEKDKNEQNNELISVQNGKNDANNADEENVCTICCDPLTSDIQYLQCTHSFHKDCIRRWITNHKTCPLCRIVVNDNVFNAPPPPSDFGPSPFDYSFLPSHSRPSRPPRPRYSDFYSDISRPPHYHPSPSFGGREVYSNLRDIVFDNNPLFNPYGRYSVNQNNRNQNSQNLGQIRRRDITLGFHGQKD